MASYVKVAGAIDFLLEGLNSGTDQWAFALTNTVPAGTTFTAGTTDLTTSGGYTQGGTNVTTTLPTGSEGTASMSDPNSMRGPIPIPYKIAQQRLNRQFSIASVLGYMPDGWSLAIRNATGAAFSTGCVVSYRTLNFTI